MSHVKVFMERGITMNNYLQESYDEALKENLELTAKFKIAAKALDDIMNIELTQDGETMYMNILEIRNIVGVARMKIKAF